MNWVNFAIAAQRIFFCAVATAVAGSVFVMILLLLGKISKWKNSRIRLVWIKTGLILYLFPIASLLAMKSRISMYSHGILWSSEFLNVSTVSMRRGYIYAAAIWLFGMAMGIVFRFIQYRKLKNLLKGNIPVADNCCQKLIDKYKEKNEYRHVQFYQNDLISFPMTVGSIRPMIILPMTIYTEKQMHMVLEHEMNHVKSRDLVWKEVALLVTFIHWWNPLVYILLEKLILQEEIECDIRTCENNDHFTMKEYGYYLSGMEDSGDDMIFVSALCKSKKNLFRRLEGMVRGNKCRKRTAVVSCIVLSMLAVIPSYAASEGVARENEKWIAKTEVATEVKEIDYRAMESTSTVAEEKGVEEIVLTVDNETIPFSTEITLDYTIKANTRILYRWQDMQEGDTIHVSAKCSNSSIVYRIGIRDSAGNLSYRQGSGSMSHIFEIPSDGEYTVYVENKSSTSMQVTGWARYSD